MRGFQIQQPNQYIVFKSPKPIWGGVGRINRFDFTISIMIYFIFGIIWFCFGSFYLFMTNRETFVFLYAILTLGVLSSSIFRK